MAFKTLQGHHFAHIPEGAEKTINGIIQDITPYDTLNEGTIDEIKVYGPDDMQLMGKAMYNEARKELMKEVVELNVDDVGINYIDFTGFETDSLGINVGDKVRIIIVKEN